MNYGFAAGKNKKNILPFFRGEDFASGICTDLPVSGNPIPLYCNCTQGYNDVVDTVDFHSIMRLCIDFEILSYT